MERSGRLNEYVVISHAADGTYEVVYGSRSNPGARYRCNGFADVSAAIAWVDQLDRTIERAICSATARARHSDSHRSA